MNEYIVAVILFPFALLIIWLVRSVKVLNKKVQALGEFALLQQNRNDQINDLLTRNVEMLGVFLKDKL